MTSSLLPFLRHADPLAVVARGAHGVKTAQEFMSEAHALAMLLPPGRHVVNFCADRYRFAVGFAAALLREQVTLLPMSGAVDRLPALAHDYPDLYLLHDEPQDPAGLRALRYPQASISTRTPPAPHTLAFPSAQTAVVLFTSGSTGDPQPYPRSWGALVTSSRAAGRRLGIASGEALTLLGTVPHQHSYGLESVLMLGLQHGLAFDTGRPLLPADIVARLQTIPGECLLVSTPLHLRSLLEAGPALPSLAGMLCATAPLAPSLAASAEAAFRAPLHEIYGCTEVGQIATRRTVTTSQWQCLDDIELRQTGDSFLASGAAAANVAELSDHLELLGEGRFLLLGRKTDLINIAGNRHSLTALNFFLNAIPGVEDGVFVMPAGEGEALRLTAYVVAPTLTQEEILTALRLVVDPVFLPRPLHRVQALPRNALGKFTQQSLLRMRDEDATG